MLARPTSKTSIGKVFQDRAARFGDRSFLEFGDQQLTYREANADRQPLRGGAGRARRRPRRRRRHHAAQLTQRRADDAGRGQVRRDRRHAQLPPARRRAGAQPRPAGRQGAGRRNRPGRARSPSAAAPGSAPMTIEEMERLAATAPTTNPPSASAGAGQGHRVLHLHLGHHRPPQGQRDDPLPVAGGAGRVRRTRLAAQGVPTRCTAACRCTTTTR